MKPPICEFCHRDFRASVKEGGTVRFADYKPLPERMVGHPKGLAWFCAEHLDQAQELAELKRLDALRMMRARLGNSAEKT